MEKTNVSNNDGVSWVYSDVVKDHFINPRNFISEEKPVWDYDGAGEVGSPACGDVMKIWIQVKESKINKIGWKTFGCASAIASTSMLSEMVIENGGMALGKAKKITARDIVAKLGGLPKKKIHCSVLGDQALKRAIEDYQKNN